MKSIRPAASFKAFVAAFALLFTACQHRTNSTDNQDLAGVYPLVSVNGKTLPAQISHGNANLEVRAGSFTFNADGTCGTSTVFVPPSGKEVKREVSASYTREGGQIKMKWKGAGRTTGVLEGQTFTMNNEGMLFVYRK